MRAGLCIAVLVLTSVVRAAGAADPREPLTFQNAGLYGGWNNYFVSKDSPFDFLIIQARVSDGKVDWHGKGAEKRSWNDWLKLARSNGKRVIADLGVTLTVNGHPQSFQELYNVEKPAPLEQFLPLFDRFFDEVDEQELYAVTIGEEQVFWNGQQERLEQVYSYLKKKYDVPLYQWWSPSETGATVGMSWPNLPADGWALDEYFMQQPAMEAAMRMYTIMQKPCFQIIWAAPDMPSVPWSEKTFWDQYAVCRKYDIPVAFFNWTGPNQTPHSLSWAWESNASAAMREVFEDYCIRGARLSKRLPPVPNQEWDFVPWVPKRIKLEPGAEGKAVYEDTFVKPREIASWRDAAFTGFANLKWDSSPLQLAPRAAGKAEAAARYVFQCARKPARVLVRVAGKTTGGSVQVEVRDTQDGVLTASTLTGESVEVTVDPTEWSDPSFAVVVRMEGSADKPGTLLAEFTSILVECEFAGD